MKFIDSTGEKFGRLTAVSRIPNTSPIKWLCKCDCGNEAVVAGTKLRYGSTRSCGCLKDEKVIERSTKHGYLIGGYIPEYNTWTGMINRCENERNPNYSRYGERGISICKRWREDFGKFMEDMGPKPSSRHSIDRIDVNGNYEPENCRWSTPREQMNNVRNNRFITAFGETKTIANWTTDERCKASYKCLIRRIERGHNPEGAITEPTRTSKTGVNGVYMTRYGRNRYTAHISLNQEKIILGRFKTLEEASAARKDAKLKYWNKSS